MAIGLSLWVPPPNTGGGGGGSTPLQYMVPGYGFVNEASTAIQSYMVPGWGFLNESAS